MSNFSDEQLQLAIAKELPELITVHGPYSSDNTDQKDFYIFRFTDRRSPRITPREWDWIVKQLIKNCTSFPSTIRRIYSDLPLNCCWQVVAEAYFKIIDKKIV